MAFNPEHYYVVEIVFNKKKIGENIYETDSAGFLVLDDNGEYLVSAESLVRFAEEILANKDKLLGKQIHLIEGKYCIREEIKSAKIVSEDTLFEKVLNDNGV